MKNKSAIIWGLFLIFLGLLLVLKTFNIINFNIFFDGWWTLFIIVPCAIGLIKDDNKSASFIGIIIGILLLLGAREIIDYSLIWKLLFPIIIITFGVTLVIKNFINKEFEDNVKNISTSAKKDGYTAVFSEQDINLNDQEIGGTNMTAVFGNINLDLRKSIIKKDIVINSISIFGGIEILVPDNIKVVIKSNSVFGGVNNKKRKNEDKKDHIIYINATCLFGGVDIK